MTPYAGIGHSDDCLHLVYCHPYIRSHFLYFSICRRDNELCDLKKEERRQKFQDICKIEDHISSLETVCGET